MKKKLLEELGDVTKRKFPLIFKHIIHTGSDINIDEVNSDLVFISPERDSQFYCESYYKPISKLK